jgi:carbamoyl-phosphate synthase large subunit
LAGIHSGDSACTIPSQNIPEKVLEKIRKHTFDLAGELNVIGLMNVQYAVKDDEVYILEVNPRASRTVPFVSKAIGVPLAKIASLTMVGRKLSDIGFTHEIIPKHVSVKEAVFPFKRFPGIDIVLSPEMKSTGEVMGIDQIPGLAYLKSQMAAGGEVPRKGNMFLSVRNLDKDAIVELAREYVELGFTIYATPGTSTILRNSGVKSNVLLKISEGRPNILDMMLDNEIAIIINTPSPGPAPKVDEIRMRADAVLHGVPIITTISGAAATLDGLKALNEMGVMEISTIQEYHSDSIKLDV